VIDDKAESEVESVEDENEDDGSVCNDEAAEEEEVDEGTADIDGVIGGGVVSITT
jgi:hypothetical protein